MVSLHSLCQGHLKCSFASPKFSSWTTTQSNQKDRITKQVTHFLNCVVTCPETEVKDSARGVASHVSGNCSHSSEPKAESQIAGIFFLTTRHPLSSQQETKTTDPLTSNATFSKAVTSAFEGEATDIFFNFQKGAPLRHMLIEMDHHHPPTLVEIDNGN